MRFIPMFLILALISAALSCTRSGGPAFTSNAPTVKLDTVVYAADTGDEPGAYVQIEYFHLIEGSENMRLIFNEYFDRYWTAALTDRVNGSFSDSITLDSAISRFFSDYRLMKESAPEMNNGFVFEGQTTIESQLDNWITLYSGYFSSNGTASEGSDGLYSVFDLKSGRFLDLAGLSKDSAQLAAAIKPYFINTIRDVVPDDPNAISPDLFFLSPNFGFRRDTIVFYYPEGSMPAPFEVAVPKSAVQKLLSVDF